MRIVCLLILLLPLAACEPTPRYGVEKPAGSAQNSKNGITISGNAHVGVSGRF